MSFSFLPPTVSSPTVTPSPPSLPFSTASATTTAATNVNKRSRLVRTQTPIPSHFFNPTPAQDDTLQAQTASNTLVNRNMLRINTPLFWDLGQQHGADEDGEESDSESDDGSYRNTDSESDSDSDSDDENNNSNKNEAEDSEEQGGRERIHSVLDLDSQSSCSAATAPTAANNDAGSPRTLAMQANKRTKRVRVDDSSAASMAFSGKRVRFDEAKNTVHVHHRNSSIVSPPDSPTPGTGTATTTATATTTRPIVSALSSRYSHQTSPSSPSLSALFSTSLGSPRPIPGSYSPGHFELSLQNTSQEVMDFASSLSRLMGGAGSGGSSASSSLGGTQDPLTFMSPPLSQIPIGSPIAGSSSPLRSFNSMFQAAPPSPVRPPFLSAAYSPPSSSSLSSCWSPLMDSDSDDGNEGATMMSPPLHPRPLSPSRPTPREKTSFSPRRPRNTGTVSGTNTGMQATVTTNAARRFPALLRREASNASFLDAYPASLAPDPEPEHGQESSENVTLPVPRIATTPPREGTPSNYIGSGSSMSHSAIAAAVLNMSMPVPAVRLTKSSSDLVTKKSMRSKEFQFEMGRNHKRSASLDDNDNSGTTKQRQPLSFSPRAMIGDSSLVTPPDSQMR